MSLSPDQLWSAAQEELRFQVSRPGYEAWLKNARLLHFDEGGAKAVIGVSTPLARDWVSDRYGAVIRETLSAILNQDVTVEFTVQGPPGAEPLPQGQLPVPPPDPGADGAGETVPGLNPRYTFNTFVVGNTSSWVRSLPARNWMSSTSRTSTVR